MYELMGKRSFGWACG